MVRTAEIVQDKKLDAQAFAEALEKLPEGDKREIMGYIKCMYSSARVPRTPDDGVKVAG